MIRQSQQAYSIGVVNALQGLLAVRAKEYFPWLAFVYLLFGIAGAPGHIVSALPVCLNGRSV